MATIECEIRGQTPLVMNNGEKADPDGVYAERVADLKNKRKKSPEDRELLGRIEFQGGLYWNEKIGPYLPDGNILASLIEGGRVTKNGKDITAFVSCEPTEEAKKRGESFVKLEYEGPRDVESMWRAAMFDRRLVSSNGKPGGPKVIRYRPVFKGWSAKFVLEVDDECDPAVVVQALKDAGRRVGVCERKRFRWGRFEVERAKIK